MSSGPGVSVAPFHYVLVIMHLSLFAQSATGKALYLPANEIFTIITA
jgi:hypothetical protein